MARSVAWFPCGILLFAGCTGSLDDQLHTSPTGVIGGEAETHYPPAGYMAFGPSPEQMTKPYCGATLIAPRIAVTAGHCVTRVGSYGMGFGAVGSGTIYMAAHVLEHPQHDRTTQAHDIAVLLFDEEIPVAPAGVGEATVGAVVHHVGYGRTTTGDASREDGYTNERKGLDEKITEVSDGRITARPLGGGNCFGDSGGPLFTKFENTVLGVVSYGPGDCQVEQWTVFTSLTAEQAFLDHATDCVADSSTADCGFASEPTSASDCGDVTAEGECLYDGRVQRCVAGKLYEHACDGTCGWDAAAGQYDCVASVDEDACYGVTERGECDGNHLWRCVSGKLYDHECADGTTCSYGALSEQYDCLGDGYEDPCQRVPELGECGADNVLRRCVDGILYEHSCDEGTICDIDGTTGSAECFWF